MSGTNNHKQCLEPSGGPSTVHSVAPMEALSLVPNREPSALPSALPNSIEIPREGETIPLSVDFA